MFKRVFIILLTVFMISACSTGKEEETPESVYARMQEVNSSSRLRNDHQNFRISCASSSLESYSFYDDQSELHYSFEQNQEPVYAYIERGDFRYELLNGAYVQNLYMNSEDKVDIWKHLTVLDPKLKPEELTDTDVFTILKATLAKEETEAYLEKQGLLLQNIDHLEETFMLDKETYTILNRKEEVFFADKSSEVILEEEYAYDIKEESNDCLKQINDHFRDASYERSLQVIQDFGQSNEKQTTYRVAYGDTINLILNGKQIIDMTASTVDSPAHNNDMVYYVYSDGVIPEAKKEEEKSEVKEEIRKEEDASGFVLLSDVIPDAILDIRYYSSYNFVGERINGYAEPIAFLTKEAAKALKEVSDELISKGYRLKIYDAYRPQRAVDHFVSWSKNADEKMKQYFYPDLEKNQLFPQGFIMEKSAHSRGSSVDLTLFDMATGQEVDMGGAFDFFGEVSHGDHQDLSDLQKQNRQLLNQTMKAHGFEDYPSEWWHFTLKDEPYPDTYFNFPISSSSITQ